ncbi:TetR family transcriptional regulator [Rhodococcus erythropolis]|uniref:TetR family transcriptional regulator n=1 Tax=Rhodococcus erythropolis TaxID=1833 RepID=UPI00366C363D
MNNHTDRSEGIDHGKTGRPPMQPRAKITREAILEVSATLFGQTGYAGTSINDILAISETTKGAMYFHFSKKDPSRARCSAAGPPQSPRQWGRPQRQVNPLTGKW